VMSRSPTHAGGVVFRMKRDSPEFLLVTARSPRVEWVYPKGRIERGEDPAAAAVREVEEEAGVRATIVEPLGAVTVRVGGQEQTVQYFLMTTDDPGESREGRNLMWAGAAQAEQHLAFPESVASLRQALALLQRRVRGA
jgi:8-oxo-dGTP pyrophosphatase MutT (NUDIX family)